MRLTASRIIFSAIVILFNFAVLWSLRCPDDYQPRLHPRDAEIVKSSRSISSTKSTSTGHKLAIIIPFRDRFDELLEFAPALHKFLNEASVDHEIFVINQADKYRFNRASLINVGYIYTADKGFDYLVMHDVDLIPTTHQIKYSYPENGPVHLASPDLHPLYHYENYVGGILLLTHQHFKMCRGMATKFWGWGREDDEFFIRMKNAKLTINRPQGVTTGYHTYRHVHDKEKRKRDYTRTPEQKKDQFKPDKEGGYDNLKYAITKVDLVEINSTPVNVIHVELECDLEKTPWCDIKKPPK